ncbi:MAG: hypothetical protein WC657_07105 [Candidatus Paceibacterota bacterium]|jgi:site-specific DNA-methyltransferase (adenine-specific)
MTTAGYTLIQADVVRWLRGNEWQVQNGFMPKYHAVLSDAPYGIAFMNKKWDTLSSPQAFQAWVTEWGRLLLSFVYPGAVGLFFGGDRTHHRLTAGLEDAGWEIATTMVYMYGSGFPKGLDLSKAIDRTTAVPCPQCMGAGFLVIAGKTPGDYERAQCDKCEGTGRVIGAEREVVGVSQYADKGRRIDNRVYGQSTPSDSEFVTAPATPDAERWQGYNVALKPAYEAIVLARAPRDGTYAQCATRYGTSALNVDGCRIGVDDNEPNKRRDTGGHTQREEPEHIYGKGLYNSTRPATLTAGRWPANVILDDVAAAMLDEMSAGQRCDKPSASGGYGLPMNSMYAPGVRLTDAVYYDSGGASRFFYTAKADAFERTAGLTHLPPTNVNDGRESSIDNPYQRGDTLRRCTHPTMKPLKLTEYLARLILPPPLNEPRRLLVPFSGVASEMIGARLAGWDHVTGIELSSEYIPQAEARLRWWSGFTSYEQARAAYAADRGEQEQRADEAAQGVQQLGLFAQEARTG